jgi:hypothetical protein
VLGCTDRWQVQTGLINHDRDIFNRRKGESEGYGCDDYRTFGGLRPGIYVR